VGRAASLGNWRKSRPQQTLNNIKKKVFFHLQFAHWVYGNAANSATTTMTNKKMLKSFSECEKLLLLMLLLLLPLLLPMLLLSRLAAVFALYQAFKNCYSSISFRLLRQWLTEERRETGSWNRATWRMHNMQLCPQLSQINSLCSTFIEQIARANVDRINKNIICCDLAQREMQTPLHFSSLDVSSLLWKR